MTELDRRLSILLVVSDLGFGGAERQVLHLARSLDSTRFKVRICSLSANMPLLAQAAANDLSVSVVAKRHTYDFTVVPRLRRIIRECRADIVHSFLFDAQIATRLAGCLAGTLVIDSERNANQRVSFVQRAACRLTRGCSDLVIANSHAGAAFHRGLYGHPAESYRVIHNGVDVDRFAPRPRDLVRTELGLDRADLFVGIFGSFKPQKNHALLFRSVARLIARHPRLRLLVVGDALAGGLGGSFAHKQTMLRLVEQLGIASRCFMLGNRSNVEVLYNACDIVVLPSLFEGTPNVALEAMACGIPIVATDVGDCRRIVIDGEVGFVVPSGDEGALTERVDRLLSDPALCERFGFSARRWVTDNFSLKQLARQTGDVYESLWQQKRC